MAASWNLVNDTERHASMMAAGEILAGAVSMESGAAAIGRALLTLTDARSAAVFFRSPSGAVSCPWSHNLSDAYVGDLVTPAGINPWLHLLRCPELTCMDMQKRTQIHTVARWLVADIRELPRANVVRRRIEREGLRSVCTWPISRAGQVIGAIAYYYDAPHVCSPSEEDLMRAFALQAAAAVPNGISRAARPFAGAQRRPRAGEAVLRQA
jgi:GAF domain-containing protein